MTQVQRLAQTEAPGSREQADSFMLGSVPDQQGKRTRAAAGKSSVRATRGNENLSRRAVSGESQRKRECSGVCVSVCVCKLAPPRPPAVARLRVLKGLSSHRNELILILFLI